MNDRIIKPGAVGGTPASLFAAAKIVKAEAYDASIEATQIVDAAYAQARKIVEDAEHERRTVLATAREEGYERGLQQWNGAVADVNAARDRYLAENEPELIRLAVRIAQKIIGAELRVNPEAIVSIARECLQGVRRERSLTLRVPPADVDLVRRTIDVLREAVGPHRSIEVVGDPAVGSGGCIVESEYGVIDARLETQMRCLEEILLRVARK
jgi:type III secretion protein L